jgi:SAM-dependent methyltransferase
MLCNDEECRIMVGAAQPQLRTSQPDKKFKWVLENFFADGQLAASRILELGPGQFDFSRLAMAAGATITTMDYDPAVVALGRQRGYDIIEADFRTFDWSTIRGEFDGLFVCDAIAPHWFTEAAALQEFVDQVCLILRPRGWGWVLPWNRYVKRRRAYVAHMLNAQREAFERNGFVSLELTRLYARTGGKYSPTAKIHDRRDLFIKGLNPGPQSLNARRLRAG